MVGMGSSVSTTALVPEIAEPAIGSHTRKQAVKCLVQIETLWRQQRCFILSHELCCATLANFNLYFPSMFFFLKHARLLSVFTSFTDVTAKIFLSNV